jgi:putative hemolysin
MKRLWIVLFLVAVVILAACGSQTTPTPSTLESPLPTPGADIPNPASQFCVDKGYQLEIRTAADGGQTGYCLFPDGTECEEWAYHRNECGPGTPKP